MQTIGAIVKGVVGILMLVALVLQLAYDSPKNDSETYSPSTYSYGSGYNGTNSYTTTPTSTNSSVYSGTYPSGHSYNSSAGTSVTGYRPSTPSTYKPTYRSTVRFRR